MHLPHHYSALQPPTSVAIKHSSGAAASQQHLAQHPADDTPLRAAVFMASSASCASFVVRCLPRLRLMRANPSPKQRALLLRCTRTLPLTRAAMSDTQVATVAHRISADEATFASLPLPLAHRIFLALHVVARGRASCVCRAWRDALADPTLWTRLDMSLLDEDAQDERFLPIVRGAAGRAQGQLYRLKFTRPDVEQGGLLPVLTANAGSLRELHLCEVDADDTNPHNPTVQAVVAAAPLLQVVAAEEVSCTWEHAPKILRSEPPFALLQLRGSLFVDFDGGDGFVTVRGDMDRVGPFATALADAALQPALSEVCFWSADTAQPAVIDALVDAALARRLRKLAIAFCTPPAAAPLVRLLAGGTLTALEVTGSFGDASATPQFDAVSAALVADALRMNTTLTKLKLRYAGLCHDMRVAGALLGALLGHPSLRELHVTGENNTVTAEARSALGAALAALRASSASWTSRSTTSRCTSCCRY
jgi:hypothetical protein